MWQDSTKISQNLYFCWKLHNCFQHARRHISHLIRSSRAGYNKFVTVEVLSFVQIWPLAIISSQFDFVLTIEVNKNFCCFTLYLSLLLQKFSKVSLKILLCPASQVYNLFFNGKIKAKSFILEFSLEQVKRFQNPYYPKLPSGLNLSSNAVVLL